MGDAPLVAPELLFFFEDLQSCHVCSRVVESLTTEPICVLFATNDVCPYLLEQGGNAFSILSHFGAVAHIPKQGICTLTVDQSYYHSIPFSIGYA